MNNWADLPTEILDNVFQSLSKRDYCQCSVTCRSWESAAQRVLFQKIPFLNDKKMNSLLDAFSVYGDDNKQSPGNFVKEVDITYLVDDCLVEHLDKAFPCLEKIIFGTARRNSSLLYAQALQWMQMGHFPNLKSFPLLRLDEPQLHVLMARKDRIKEIVLGDFPSSYPRIEELLPILRLFTKLEKLDLRNTGSTKICLDDLLQNIPSPLKTLFIHYCFLSGRSTVGMNGIEPISGLKKFGASNTLLLGGDKAFLYLMVKLPHLEYLDLGHFEDNICEVHNYAFLTKACAVLFLVYLFRMRLGSKVCPIMTNHATSEVVENFFSHVLEEGSSPSRIVQLELRIIFHHILSPTDEPEHSRGRFSYIAIENSTLSSKKLCLVEVVYKVMTGSIFERHLKLLERIKDMEISFLSLGDVKRHDGRSPETQINLTTALDILSKLKKLKLFHVEIICAGSNQISQASALESVEILGCNLTPEILLYLSRRFSRLNTLTLIECNYPTAQQSSDSHYRNRYSIKMPYTRLESLTVRMPMSRTFYWNVALNLTTNNKKPRYCGISECSIRDDFEERDYTLSMEDRECDVFNIQFEQVTKWNIEGTLGVPDERGGLLTLKKVYSEED